MVNIPNYNNISPIYDDDDYSESSEGSSVDINDKEIDKNPNNVTIPVELISHLRPY